MMTLQSAAERVLAGGLIDALALATLTACQRKADLPDNTGRQIEANNEYVALGDS